MQVNVLEAKNRLSQLIRAAQAGEDVVIANRGQPAVRLVPADAGIAPADIGSGHIILDWLKAHPLPAHARRSEAEIDAAIEEERRSWD